MKRVAFACALLFATTLAAEDSPLVAAAKRTNRANPKAKVITNETLSKSGGHISTTASQAPINLPKETPKETKQEAAKVTVVGAQQETKPAPQAPPQRVPAPLKRDDAEVISRTQLAGPYWELPKGMSSEPQKSQQPKAPDSSQKPTVPEPSQKPKPPQ